MNDSEVPTEPTRYPVVPVPASSLPAASASSADALICSPPHGATVEGGERPQASEHSIEQVDPQAPGWTRRYVCVADSNCMTEYCRQIIGFVLGLVGGLISLVWAGLLKTLQLTMFAVDESKLLQKR